MSLHDAHQAAGECVALLRSFPPPSMLPGYPGAVDKWLDDLTVAGERLAVALGSVLAGERSPEYRALLLTHDNEVSACGYVAPCYHEIVRMMVLDVMLQAAVSDPKEAGQRGVSLDGDDVTLLSMRLEKEYERAKNRPAEPSVTAPEGGCQEPPPPLVKVDLARMTVAVRGGKPKDVSSKQALRWLRVLAEHPGEWISAPEMAEYDEELVGIRPDRQCKRFLPKAILRLIESDRRKGSRLRLP